MAEPTVQPVMVNSVDPSADQAHLLYWLPCGDVMMVTEIRDS
jgi:hypothetical protein